MNRKISILLIDDHSLFRESLGRLLQAESALEIVGNCGSVAEGLAVLREKQVDIVLLDYDMGDERGMSFQKEAPQYGFKGRIIIVTAGMGDQEIINALESGISGIFFKSSTPAQLIEAINKVTQGEPWLDPNSMKAVISAAAAKSQQKHSIQPLNPRERAVLRGIFEGLANKEIAAELNLSESSVKAVIQQLFDKTGVRTRGQLVRIALERRKEGWI